MIQIKFKNLDKSELAREAVEERLAAMIEKFGAIVGQSYSSHTRDGKLTDSSQASVFKVKVHISRGPYKGVTIEKSEPNLYAALAEVVDHMLEVLNRYGDRIRVKQRKQARDIARVEMKPQSE